jgi:peptidoglycan hydrolase-like protein with peptidoglycan-binding domain
MKGPDVKVIQRKLFLFPSGEYDRIVERTIRGFQAREGLAVTGEVDALTAGRLGESAASELPPAWFTGSLALGDQGAAVEAVRGLLGLPRGTMYDEAVDSAVRRLRSALGLPPGGGIDLPVARHLGDL